MSLLIKIPIHEYRKQEKYNFLNSETKAVKAHYRTQQCKTPYSSIF